MPTGSLTQRRGTTRPSCASIPATLRGPASRSWSAGDHPCLLKGLLQLCSPILGLQTCLSQPPRDTGGETGSPQPRATRPWCSEQRWDRESSTPCFLIEGGSASPAHMDQSPYYQYLLPPWEKTAKPFYQGQRPLNFESG